MELPPNYDADPYFSADQPHKKRRKRLRSRGEELEEVEGDDEVMLFDEEGGSEEIPKEFASRTEYMHTTYKGKPSTAEVEFYDDFFQDDAERLFEALADTQWDLMFERNQYNPMIRNARLMKWYSDNHQNTYAFSTNTLGGYTLATGEYNDEGLKANALTPALKELRQRVVDLLKSKGVDAPMFNSVLVNYYRNQSDAVAWHSDEDKWLGDRFMVPSISLGAERFFRLKSGTDPVTTIAAVDKAKQDGTLNEWKLKNGSLLLMKGMTQEGFQHSVPKMTRVKLGPRINVTFRHVIPEKRKLQPKTQPFTTFLHKQIEKWGLVLDRDTSGKARSIMKNATTPQDVYALLSLIKTQKKTSGPFMLGDLLTERMKKKEYSFDQSYQHLQTLLSKTHGGAKGKARKTRKKKTLRRRRKR